MEAMPITGVLLHLDESVNGRVNGVACSCVNGPVATWDLNINATARLTFQGAMHYPLTMEFETIEGRYFTVHVTGVVPEPTVIAIWNETLNSLVFNIEDHPSAIHGIKRDYEQSPRATV